MRPPYHNTRVHHLQGLSKLQGVCGIAATEHHSASFWTQHPSAHARSLPLPFKQSLLSQCHTSSPPNCNKLYTEVLPLFPALSLLLWNATAHLLRGQQAAGVCWVNDGKQCHLCWHRSIQQTPVPCVRGRSIQECGFCWPSQHTSAPTCTPSLKHLSDTHTHSSPL